MSARGRSSSASSRAKRSDSLTRGPERFFYDKSTYTGAHKGKCGPGDLSIEIEEPANEPTKAGRERRICPMCEHTSLVVPRSVIPCPNCLAPLPSPSSAIQLIAEFHGVETALRVSRQLASGEKPPRRRTSNSSEASVASTASTTRMRSSSPAVNRLFNTVRTAQNEHAKSAVLAFELRKAAEPPRVRRLTNKPPLPSAALSVISK